MKRAVFDPDGCDRSNMRELTRYTLRQLVVVTLFVTGVLTLAVWLSQSLRFMDFIVNRGLPLTDFLMFVGLLAPGFLGLVLPIAAFCAVVFVYNKLGNESELVVMRAAGLSQFQLAKPALILAVGVVLIAYAISLYALPATFRAFKDLQYEMRHDVSTVLLQEGAFSTLSDDITVYVRERGPEGELHGILIHDSREAEEPVTMMATRGALIRTQASPRILLVDGNRQEVDPETGRLSMLYFDRYTVELDDVSRSAEGRWRQPKERFLPALLNPEDEGADVRNRNELIAEGHRRLTFPLYTLAFVGVGLVAILGGEFSRRGQTRRIIAAVAAVAGLQMAQLALTDLSVRSLSFLPATYLALVLFVAVPFYLFLRPRSSRRRASGPDQRSPGDTASGGGEAPRQPEPAR